VASERSVEERSGISKHEAGQLWIGLYGLAAELLA
jgi:hypothetical protein